MLCDPSQNVQDLRLTYAAREDNKLAVGTQCGNRTNIDSQPWRTFDFIHSYTCAVFHSSSLHFYLDESGDSAMSQDPSFLTSPTYCESTIKLVVIYCHGSQVFTSSTAQSSALGRTASALAIQEPCHLYTPCTASSERCSRRSIVGRDLY